MNFLQRLALRLGFLLVLALLIRGAGALFSPAHPRDPEMVAVPDRSGETHYIPKQAIESSTLAASLYDSDMHVALQVLSARRGGSLGTGEGAKMTFPSPEGPVTLSASELQALNAEYRRFKAKLAGVDAGNEDPSD